MYLVFEVCISAANLLSSVFLYVKIDFGFCVYALATLCYWIVYPYVLYGTVKADSIYCREKGIYKSLGPNLSHSTSGGESGQEGNFNLLSPTMENDPLMKDSVIYLDEDSVDDFSNLEGEYKIEHEDLRLGKRVGVGGAGEVFKGTWKGSIVAVKKIFKMITKEERKSILKELEIMKVCTLQTLIFEIHDIKFFIS